MALLFFTFVAQELISSTIILTGFLHDGGQLYEVVIIFFLATTLDIFVGYALGVYIKKYYSHTPVFTYLNSKLKYIFPEDLSLEKHLALFIFGPIVFPVTTLLVPILEIKILPGYLIVLCGEIIFWLLPAWVLSTGLLSFFTVGKLHVSLFLPILAIILFKFFLRRRRRKS